jgi:5-methyltetrahydrofolate--homocysteine methyltransferase
VDSQAGYPRDLYRAAEERILILDGAMGSLLQREGLTGADYRGGALADHKTELAGCNELLCLTRPDLITSIHEAYLEAGADIISSCSLSSNAVSLADYGLADRAYEISRAAGILARTAADKYGTAKKPRFAAGSVGPTSKSASISPDMEDPSRRSVDWDELEGAYREAIRGLLDGGVHLILLETFFDTLNAKAAAAAVMRLREERREAIPLIISATISGPSGRLLSGQTVEAFAVSLAHAGPWALGLNCSLGAEKLLPHLEALASFTPFLVSCHPNAGLPDQMGNYAEGPEETAAFIKAYLDRGLVNILGGCCGTTPAHIAAVADLARRYAPRIPPQKSTASFLAGLEVLPVGEGKEGFTPAGERTNVAGSRKFLRLVRDQAWDQAVNVAREMITAGSRITDVCMDDALLDGKAAMVRFLNLALADPEIARFPVMPDSSRWDILEAALKCIQGKALVNSISLKEGEDEFLRRAGLLRRYGAAAVVMLFDERGQAHSYERKTEIAARSYRILLGAGFPPEDIVFDPNVLAIATGMAEHDRHGLDFIRACAWIREHCPGVQISGGLSNLSFSFRGNEEIRAALHGAFLKHAAASGLSMAILNPASLVPWGEIRPALREAAEDAVLCRGGGNYTERLLALAAAGPGNAANPGAAETGADTGEWRNLPAEERIRSALLKGTDTFIEEDVQELGRRLSPMEIIEGPLMQGMLETGRRFGEGTMFLPQVVRSARIMKKAAALLAPFMEKSGAVPGAEKIVIATVRGDVHDIGKNIAAVVMNCGGYRVIDLGIMVPRETILDTSEKEKAGAVGLSGLISPSLEEMVRVAEEMERRRFTIPLLIGGAAASPAHTALRIAPVYSGPVVYVRDAGESAAVLHALFSGEREQFLADIKRRYGRIRLKNGAAAKKRVLKPLEEARKNPVVSDWKKNPPPAPRIQGLIHYDDYPPEGLFPRINWEAFYRFWELGQGSGADVNRERTKIRSDGEKMLARIALEKTLTLRGVLGFFPASSGGEDITVSGGGGYIRFYFLRNQETKSSGGPNPCLADYIPPETEKGWIGFFALSAGFGFDDAAAGKSDGDYQTLLLAALADRLAEAFAEDLFHLVREDLWPSPYPFIRPAFGYPIAPDHRDKELCFRLLEAEKRTGMSIGESGMITPVHSVCGMYITHPEAAYFSTGPIAADQLAVWAERKGLTLEEARRRIGTL